jgi:beta propeller repeat protein
MKIVTGFCGLTMQTLIIVLIVGAFIFVQGVQAAQTCDNPLYLTFAESRSLFAQHAEVQAANVVFSENGNIYLLDLAGLTLKEITVDGGNSEPVISDSRVAWVHNNPAGTLTTRNNSSQIMVYEIKTGSTRPITTGTAIRSQPAFSGEILVWTDSRNGNLDIYGYDFARENETQLSKNTSDQDSPAIYSKKVVWRDKRDRDHPQIYVYDLETLEFASVSGTDVIDPREPGIYGDRIIWTDRRNRIFTYDLSTKTESSLPDEFIQAVNASIYKDRVIWHDIRGWQSDRPPGICRPDGFCIGETQPPKDQSVFIYDLTKKTDTEVFTRWIPSLSPLRPRLSDDFLVFQMESVVICPIGGRKIDGTKITRIPHPSRANLIVAQPTLVGKTKTGSDENVAAISRDGKFIAAGDLTYGHSQNAFRIHLYSASGETLWEYPTTTMIYSVALSSHGEHLAAGGVDNSLYLFNKNGTLLWNYGKADGILNNTVFAVAISGDGGTIAANCADGYLYIFSRDGRVLSKINLEKHMNGIALTGDGTLIALGSENKVLLTTVNGTRVWTSAVTGRGGIEDVAISMDGSRIVAGNSDGSIVLLDQTGKILWRFAAGEGNIGVAISDDGKYIALRGGESDLYLLNSDGAVIWKYDPKDISFNTAISLSGDGTLLVAPSSGGILSLFRTDGSGPAIALGLQGGVTPTQKSPLSYASAGVALVIMIGVIYAGKMRKY